MKHQSQKLAALIKLLICFDADFFADLHVIGELWMTPKTSASQKIRNRTTENILNWMPHSL